MENKKLVRKNSLDELKKRLLKNPKFKKLYEAQDLSWDVSRAVMDLRIRRGLSQARLANKIGTKQSAIARLERGNSLPSLSFLERIAKATNSEIEFGFSEKKK